MSALSLKAIASPNTQGAIASKTQPEKKFANTPLWLRFLGISCDRAYTVT
nr:hypothetical protein [Trichocoleus desertorum]